MAEGELAAGDRTAGTAYRGVIDVIGAAGLPVTLGVICAALAAATVVRRRVL